MYILITYDVNIASENGNHRLRQISKICQNYGQRVQNSVFECIVTESQYLLLKNAIYNAMDKDNDNVRFYMLSSKWKKKIETLGKSSSIDYTDELII